MCGCFAYALASECDLSLLSVGQDFAQTEGQCALALEQLDAVKYWVRNLEKQPRHSFWLPTATDKFYPDFVAQLDDGRILVVEYKGEHLKDSPDTLEKTAVGKAWAKASGNLFLMAFKQDDAGRDIAAQVRRVM